VSGVPANVLQNLAYTNPSGPVWITTGGGGRSLYPIVTPLSPIEAYSTSAFHHVEVTIVGNQLGLAAVTPADSILDVMTITKTPTTAIALAGFQAIGDGDGREAATGAISATRSAPLRFALERPRPNPSRDGAGRQVSSGVHFAVVRAGDRELRTRVALLH